ncbi:MAG: thiaminase II [Enterococcus sp.]
MQFTEKIRKLAAPYWEASFQHPFLKEVASGRLDAQIFRYYLIQDRYYLEHFGKLYTFIGEATTDSKIKELMKQHARDLNQGEVNIRAQFFQLLEIGEEEIATTAIAPTTYHYVSHMYRQLLEGSPEVAMAGMLPCAWLYQEIGERLIMRGSPEPLYQKFIETYAGEESAQKITEERHMLDELYVKATQKEQKQMEEAFIISSQMEYLFWEMAYTFEKWPEGVENV